MKQPIKIGFVDYSTLVFIPDPASTDGSGKTGLVAANLTVSYTRVETDNDVVVTDVTGSLSDLGALTTAHTDWGLKEVSNTLAPGLYRLDIADAVFASGAWTAVVYVMITTSAAAASPMEFLLVAYDQNDGVRFGLTALPNAAADAAGGLIISDAGGLDADAQRSDVAAILADTNELQTDWTNGGRLDLILDIIAADTTTDIPGTIATLQTAVNDVPTNAELATALAAADDAVLAAVADVPTNAELATALAAADDAVLAAIAALNDPTVTEIADGLLDRDMSTGTDSGSDSVRTVRQALRVLRNKWSVAATTITYTKEDDTTTTFTAELGTSAGVDPVTSSDPAGP